MEIKYIDSVVSTNDTISLVDKNMFLVYADFQTKGKGQRGNLWESESGKNLTFSFMLKPVDVTADKQFVISKIVALSLIETLKYFNIEAKIKWPNDIYVGDMKISGILIENRLSGSGLLSRVICGVGLNVNQNIFTSDAPNPVSMNKLLGSELNRINVLNRFCEEFEQLYKIHNIIDTVYIDKKYWSALYRKEQYFTYIDYSGAFKGKIIGIGDFGELIVQRKDNDSKQTYLFKDIKYVI